MENPKSVSGGDVPSMLHSNSQESAYNVSCLLWVLDVGLGLMFRVRFRGLGLIFCYKTFGTAFYYICLPFFMLSLF